MEHLSSLGALVILALSPALALADGPPPLPSEGGSQVGGELADAAHDLTDATQALSEILDARGPSDHLYEDALTLYDASAHFEDEVILGPDDLDVDFRTLEQTFDDMKDELREATSGQHDPAAQRAWFRISEANLRLRVAWFAHWFNHLEPPPPPALPAAPLHAQP